MRDFFRRMVSSLSAKQLAILYSEVVLEINRRDGDESVETTVVELARSFFAAVDEEA